MTLLDGGTGRELLRLGAPFRQPEWSALALIEGPEFVTRVHARYIEAGADLITTNSYAVVPFHIGAARFERDGHALAELSGRLARAAADAAARPVRVAGSLPPVCGSYRPDLFDAAVARPVLQTLVHALQPYVDLWLAETVGSRAEMVLISEVVAGTGKPWWVSYTLTDAAASAAPTLRSGEPVGPAVTDAAARGARAVLFNCSQPEVMGAAVAAARQALDVRRVPGSAHVPIGVYANAFPPQSASAAANDELNGVRTDLGPVEYLDWVRRWLDDGAEIVGGCCGVGPEHIALMRASLT
ncbi:MAG: homocysteine S-methyltransferase family protein [Proteobacteria bacterium]|nr:homocysteine S-methyltransferase family protein [Pseudomonadota bacterium]